MYVYKLRGPMWLGGDLPPLLPGIYTYAHRGLLSFLTNGQLYFYIQGRASSNLS